MLVRPSIAKRRSWSAAPTGLWCAVREPVVALLLIPFLLLALMGPGTMATRTADGALTVVLCTPDGPLTVTPETDDKQPGPCAWSLVVGQPALDAAPPIIPTLIATETQLARTFGVSGHQRRIAVLAPSARGPPAPV